MRAGRRAPSGPLFPTGARACRWGGRARDRSASPRSRCRRARWSSGRSGSGGSASRGGGGEESARFGEESLAFDDPSGLVIELVGTDRDRRVPWTDGGVGEEAAIRGLHGVTMVVTSPAKTLELMTGLLGFEQVNEAEGRLRLAVNGDEPGRTIDIVSAADAPAAMNGLGTVHHVAMAVSSDDDQLRLRGELIRLGVPVTEVLDRKYFRSIYFREPGGVLFEAATVQPGFTVDEALPCLGQELQLPAR